MFIDMNSIRTRGYSCDILPVHLRASSNLAYGLNRGVVMRLSRLFEHLVT